MKQLLTKTTKIIFNVFLGLWLLLFLISIPLSLGSLNIFEFLFLFSLGILLPLFLIYILNFNKKIKLLISMDNLNKKFNCDDEALSNLEKSAKISTNLKELKNKYNQSQELLSSINSKIRENQTELDKLNLEVSYLDFGICKPVYEFANSELYKERLKSIKATQKLMIKNKNAAIAPMDFTLNNSIKEGKKLIADNVKQIIYSFNNECDILIDKVKYNNIDTYRNRILKSYERLNKMNSKMQICITQHYLNSKLDELRLSHEYQSKKQDEKERIREERARLREEAKILKEISAEREKIKKEKKHYEKALKTLLTSLKADPENKDLLEKKAEYDNQLNEIGISLTNIDYREANKRAGYVYIISNIGSLGENIYKIGMTRRLEPLDRITELSGASVPFKFDLHALIFSEDAPTLENSLHKAFENKKVNLVNSRKEFFNVSLDEIKKVVKNNFDKTVEFKNFPEAEQYRESLLIKEHSKLKAI